MTKRGGNELNRTLRRRTYEILEVGQGDQFASRAFDAFIILLILLNAAAFIAETVPSIGRRYGEALHLFNLISVAIFSVEYALRLWTAVESPFMNRLSPGTARLRAAIQPALLIDLAAILPFYLSMFVSMDLRFLRTLRLLRFLKLSRYSPAMHALIRVFVQERRSLAGAGLLLGTALLFASTGMYYLEGQVQPDYFGSIPQASWWAISTLTTVGYGDVTPITPLGRLFAGVVMVAGLCILALPVAIIATGFSQEVARRDFIVNWSLMTRIPILAQLDAGDVRHIMPLLHAHNLPPHVDVIADGGHAMFFIAAGKVILRSPSRDIEFKAGDVFATASLLSHEPSDGTFITASKCRLLKLHREDFHRIETAHPHVAERIRAAARRPQA